MISVRKDSPSFQRGPAGPRAALIYDPSRVIGVAGGKTHHTRTHILTPRKQIVYKRISMEITQVL